MVAVSTSFRHNFLLFVALLVTVVAALALYDALLALFGRSYGKGLTTLFLLVAVLLVVHILVVYLLSKDDEDKAEDEDHCEDVEECEDSTEECH